MSERQPDTFYADPYRWIDPFEEIERAREDGKFIGEMQGRVDGILSFGAELKRCNVVPTQIHPGVNGPSTYRPRRRSWLANLWAGITSGGFYPPSKYG